MMLGTTNIKSSE